MITSDHIERYMVSLIPERSELLTRMEREAEAEHIPIIQLPSIQLLRFLLMVHRPKRILEVGMAIGYSTIWLAQAAPDAHITSIEISEEMVERAQRNFAEAGISDRVTVLHQDAREGLSGEHAFDCIFLDAAKGQYQVFFDQYAPYLVEGGLLICDNVFFRGMVAEEEVPKKRRGMIQKLRAFNQFLAEHPAFETSFVSIGDGLALCIKRREVK
ncbi:O-methyltransferase [Aneurinibacillus danicus]|jgi:predicted O-methyltransferase YrrM|uniref:tRNA 5-hydroxyuridine methyltransferase n=1 Tax=Aneurinibacillus danicus TaxID=267746 RepID=A0A511VDX2_9BACL|nr:O-methyltransferase [Aneurinibacillus danicus]GEN35472.1 putative O-methyltransferase YrrM [Aneurinibacillus danicus]